MACVLASTCHPKMPELRMATGWAAKARRPLFFDAKPAFYLAHNHKANGEGPDKGTSLWRETVTQCKGASICNRFFRLHANTSMCVACARAAKPWLQPERSVSCCKHSKAKPVEAVASLSEKMGKGMAIVIVDSTGTGTAPVPVSRSQHDHVWHGNA